MISIDDWYSSWLREHTRSTGDVPPPWCFLDCHPFSIHWRMGAGEDYRLAWDRWWSERRFTEQDRNAYFRRWPPTPAWLPYVGSILSGEISWYGLDDERRSRVLEALLSAGIAARPPHSEAPTLPERIQQQTLRYGECPPPWFYVEEPPEHLFWKLRGGRILLEDWQVWWQEEERTHSERMKYFKRWGLLDGWLEFAIGMIWKPDIVYDDGKLRSGTLVRLPSVVT